MSLSQLSRSVEGSVAIVTGAASGMGRATAMVLADQGARVAALDFNAEPLQAVVAENFSALQLTRKQYEVGRIDLLSVLVIQNRWIASQISLLNVKDLRLIERVNLHLALGGSFEETPAEPAAEAPASSEAAVEEIWRNEAFVAHMHEHAEKLDELNFALADGNLEAAKAAANWLSTHDTNTDIQADWMPHLYRMREEADAVGAAADIETAQAAAMQITIQCQECHAAVGINTQ